MKKIFLSIATFISFIAYGQTPPGWTKINFSYNYVGVGADNNMIAPRYSGFPTFRGGYLGSGQIGVDTVNHIFYFASGGIWRAGTTQWTSVGSDIYYNSGGVAIGNTSVNAKAILDLTSTSKGMLTPRMNTAQMNAISSVPTGLLIYNTDSTGFVYYNGSIWQKIGTGSGGGGTPDGRGNDSLTFREEGLALGAKGSVKTINYVGQSVAATRWADSVTVFGSSNFTGYQKNNTLINNKYYDAFPSVAWDPITFATASVVWKSSGDHAGPGPGLISYSHDGFSSFTPPDTIKLNGSNLTDCNTISIGRGNKTRWVIHYQRGCCATNAIHFARNDEEDETFNADDSLVLAAYTWVAPYGDILQIHGDTLYGLGYGLKVAQSQTTVFYVKSYDNGVTWTYGADIIAGSTLNANSMPSESSMVIVSGSQVSNTKLLVLTRDDFYGGFHNENTSSDGGATWTSHFNSESNWAFQSTNSGFVVQNSWPAMLLKRDTTVYCVMGVRNTQAGGGFAMRVFKGNALSVFNSVLNWDLKYTTPYRALSFYITGGDKDFGYYHPYPTPTGEVKALFYDATAQAGLTTPYAQIKAATVLDNNVYEAFNDANQSITTGTETTVTFPDPFLDDGLYYDSDSSKIYAMADGYYTISVQLLVDTSALGTYRQAKLKIVVPGQERESVAYPTRTISKVTLQPSSNFDFCWAELHAQAFVRKGEEIRVTFKHDKGSSLNLLNTISDINIDGGGARIKIKKID